MDGISSRGDHYFTLGVKDTATAEEIRDAYRALMKQYHPDLNEGNVRANDRGKRINEAYGVLSDPKSRAEYDKWVNGTSDSSSPSNATADVKQADTNRSRRQSGLNLGIARMLSAGKPNKEVNLPANQKMLMSCSNGFVSKTCSDVWLTPKDFLLDNSGSGERIPLPV